MTDSTEPLRIAPRFILNLHSQSVRKNEDVSLSCRISGNPKPEVLWYKNGQQLSRVKQNSWYEMKEDNEVHTLNFFRCTEDDAAVYQISARNCLGMISSSAVIEVGSFTKSVIYQRLFQYPAQTTDMRSRNEANVQCIDKPESEHQRSAPEQQSKTGSSKKVIVSVGTYHSPCTETSNTQNRNGYFMENKPESVLGIGDRIIYHSPVTELPHNSDIRYGPGNYRDLDVCHKREIHSTSSIPVWSDMDPCHNTYSRLPGRKDEDLTIYEEGDLTKPVTSSAPSTPRNHTQCAEKQQRPSRYFCTSVEHYPGRNVITADEMRLQDDLCELECSDLREGGCNGSWRGALQEGDALAKVTCHNRDDVDLSCPDGCVPSLGLNGASDYTEAADITIGFCDSHSNRGELETSAVQLTGRVSALQTEMVLSAGHLQNALSPVNNRSCQLPRAATAIQNDSAAIGEEGKGVRTAGKGFYLYIPHGSVEELVEAAALHETEHPTSEEISAVMTEKPTVEELANGSAKGKRAGCSRKEDRKICKVNSAGHVSSVAASGGRREHKLLHRGIRNEVKSGIGENIKSRHSHAEDHRSSAGQLETEVYQTNPVTHIEDMDMSCTCDQSDSLSNKDIISCSSNAMQASYVNDEGDMTNGTCGSIMDDTAASVVTSMEFNNMPRPTTEICKDSYTDSETSGFLQGGFAISPSYHEVEQDINEDKCNGGHSMCDNPERTLIALDFDYPVVSSLDQDSQSQPKLNDSTRDTIKNAIYIKDANRTTQETNSAVNVHVHEKEAKGQLSPFPMNDAGYDLTEVYKQEIHPSNMNYDHISVQTYDGVKNHDLPHNSFESCNEDHHIEPPPSSLDHQIESPTNSPKCILHVRQEHTSGSSEDGLGKFTEIQSGMDTCSVQSDQTKCDHNPLPQFVVVDNSSCNSMSDSGGQLFNDIKSLLEAFSQQLEESMQRQKHQSNPFNQNKAGALTGHEWPSKIHNDGSINPPRQNPTPFRDSQNLVEILEHGNGEEKLKIGETEQNNMELSIKVFMEELLLNENVLDSLSDHENNTKSMQIEPEVEPKISVDLVDGSKVQHTPNLMFVQSHCGFVEDKNDFHDPNSIWLEEPKMSTTSRMCQMFREQVIIAEGNASNAAKGDIDGKGEVMIRNDIDMPKTYTHNYFTHVLSQSTAQPDDQSENCYRNVLEPDELTITSNQQPEHSQSSVDVACADPSVDVKSDILEITFHREEDLKSESCFHKGSDKETSLSSINDISESKYDMWKLSSLHSHTTGSVELPLPRLTYLKKENTHMADSVDMTLPICTSFKEKHANTLDSVELSLPVLTSFKEKNAHAMDSVVLPFPSTTSFKEEKAMPIKIKIASCEIPTTHSSEEEFTMQDGKIIEQEVFLKGINSSLTNDMSMSLCCSEVHQTVQKVQSPEYKICDITQDAWLTSQEKIEYHQKPSEGKRLKELLENVQPNGMECGQASGSSNVLVGHREQNSCEEISLKNKSEPKEQISEGTHCFHKVILEAKKVIVPQEQIMKFISAEATSKDSQEAPHIMKNKQAKKLLGRPKTKQLSCHFAEIPGEEDSELVAQAQRSTENDSAASSLTLQAGRKEQNRDNCSLRSKYAKEDPDFTVTAEVLEQFSSHPNVEGGEEIEFNQLFFREDFISDKYFGDNLHGRISTEDLHFGEGIHRKAFRSKVIYGLVPIFSPGHVCVLKVHNAVAHGTKTTDELVQRNYKLATQECYVQNTAREYAKMYAAEAEHLKDFGKVPEIIPIFLIHRLTNHIPYATVEEELVGDFVKYSIRDGKEINFMRRDSEAGQKCCTFQHWVYQKTNGNLLVTDMQGVGMKLTDVGIATLAKGYKGFKGNCSISFIEQFKALHLCNKYCEMMGLQSLQKQNKPAAVKTKAPSNSSATSRKTGAGAKTKGKR